MISITSMNSKVEALLKKPQYKQLSPEWFAVRPSMITASSASSLLVRDSKTCDSYIQAYSLEDTFDKNGKCCNPYSSKTQYFLERCIGSKFKGSMATFWGQKYEQVASDIYSKSNNKNILEFGLLTHSEHNWIGASPDGITECGIMLEIKCPYRRKITGIPPFYYWQQCQIQLEVCDLDICDFAEFEFVEFESESEWVDDTVLEYPVKFKGLYIQIENILPDGSSAPQDNQYFYPDKNLIDDVVGSINWANETMRSLSKNNNTNASICYWKIFNYCITRIHRDPVWFNAVLVDFQKEWNRLAYYKRDSNYKHLVSSKKRKIEENTIDICILSDSE
jgi:putative phage-type endonuclease